MVTEDGLKQCPRCGGWKLAAECFHKSNRKRVDGTQKGDGYAGYCKVCVLNRSPVEIDKRQQANREALGIGKQIGGKKLCPGCGVWKSIEADYYPSRKDGGAASKCKDCSKAALNEWAVANPERVRERNRASVAKNRPKEVHAADERARRAKDPERARAQRRDSWNSDPARSAAANKRNRERRLAKPGELERERERIKIVQHNRRVALGDIKLTVEIWSAILDTFERKCCFCDCPDDLSIEHLTPVCKGGTNHPSNLAPSCLPCNRRKNRKTAEQFCPSRAAEIRRKALICVPVEPEKEAA